MLDTQGPGCIDRMWFTRKSTKEPWDLLLFLDGGREPSVRIGLDELCAGTRPPFVAPFVGSVDLARFCYVPIGFRKSCKAVLEQTGAREVYSTRQNSAGQAIPHVYYQITYRELPRGARVRPFAAAPDPSERAAQVDAAELWRNAGEWPWGAVPALREEKRQVTLPPHGSADLAALGGQGVIYGLNVRPGDAEDSRGLRLEMNWDDTAAPAVSAPLGVFFAAPEPKQAVHGLWQGCRDGEWYCYFPMPFRRGATVRVVSDAETPLRLTARLRYTTEQPAPDDAYFHASRYDHHPPLPSEDYSVLDVRGLGHWIGLVMDRPGNMEGDDQFFVDGEREPSIHGTGTEDFFSFAWGFSHIGDLPLHGITRHYRAPVLYRVHLPAAVPFTRSLKLVFEHGHANQDQGRYSGVALYYSDRAE